MLKKKEINTLVKKKLFLEGQDEWLKQEVSTDPPPLEAGAVIKFKWMERPEEVWARGRRRMQLQGYVGPLMSSDLPNSTTRVLSSGLKLGSL